MSIIAKYKFDKTIYADLLPEFNTEFTSDKYNTTDEEVEGIITRTIESDELPTLMRFGRVWVEGEVDTDNRTDSLLEVLDMNTSGLTSCGYMFRSNRNLTSISCEWVTSNVTTMTNMFAGCNNLTSLDVSNFNTSNVADMYGMFYNCISLTSLDVSNFNTGNVTNMSYMFAYCSNLTSIDVSNFNTSNVASMEGMFNHCYNLVSIDVSNFNTSKVTSMSCMFNYCKSLTSLDVSNFDISSVVRMDGMFSVTDKLVSLDISNFSISDTTKIDYILTSTPLLTDIGMLYCDQSTINKVASLLPINVHRTIWVEDVDVKDLTPVEGVEFKQYAKDTEIMLTSPLLEGDKLIVKDGKLYHWHKMGMVVLDGSENYEWKAFGGDDTTHNRGNTIGFYKVGSGGNRLPNQKQSLSPSQLFSDRFKVGNPNESYADKRCMTADNTFNLCFDWDELPERTSDGVNQWLQANPTTVVYALASPYYELISEDPLDISLISETVDITNSSNIPLNMTINNKGLSTIAMSPSTTYTVAFDKEGEEDLTVNLCGNEITTSNNVVEITTSSELGNNELIFYGDGVEVSNVRLLEGSVSGDSVPRESFKGLKNSFEDGYISESMVNDNRYRCVLSKSQPDGVTPFEKMYPLADGNRVRSDLIEVKPNTVYTIHSSGYIIAIHEYNSDKIWIKDHLWQDTDTYTFSTRSDCTGLVVYIKKSDNSRFTEDEANSVPMILLLEEDFNHLGKYKVEYKVTGKNKFDLNKPFNVKYGLSTNIGKPIISGNGIIPNGKVGMYSSASQDYSDIIKQNTNYTISFYSENVEHNCRIYDNSTLTDIIHPLSVNANTRGRASFNIGNRNPADIRIIFHASVDNDVHRILDIQLEEGTQATPYEPYKSYTKTFYLNSPLLEGDTIEDINGVATHVKRYSKVVLDGSEDWFISTVEIPDDTTLVAFKYRDVRFANSGSSITFCENYGTDANIVIRYLTSETVRNFNHNFNNMELVIKKEKLLAEDVASLKVYLRDNPITAYCKLASPIYEPISTEPILCDSYVNGHLDVDTNIPIEKVKFDQTHIYLKYIQPNTTYTLQFESDNIGKIENVFCNNSYGTLNVVKGINKFTFTTPAEIQWNILDLNGIGFNASNIQVVATDRDADFGYFKGLQSSFEEKTAENLFDESCLSTWWLVTATNIDKTDTSGKYFSIITKAEEGKKYTIKYDYMNRYIYAFLDENYNILRGSSEISMFTTFQAPKNTKYLMCYISSNGIKEEDYDNIQVVENSENFGYEVKCKVVGKNKFNSELELGDLNGYTGVEQNSSTRYRSKFISVIPNTQYTITHSNSNTKINTVYEYDKNKNFIQYVNTYPSYTSSNETYYIRFKTDLMTDNIQLEEGTQATPYEPYQEYSKTIYLNSPLLKGDTIEVHNGKLCHYHKMGMVILDGSEDWVYQDATTSCNMYLVSENAKPTSIPICDRFIGTPPKTGTNHDKEGIGIKVRTDSKGEFVLNISKTKLSTTDAEGFKQWLSENPITVVYELAEPYYEEIVPMQEDLIITSVKEGDLHIDTIVPISSKVTYNVNVQLLTDFEQSIVEQVQATQTTDLQSILDEEIDN